MSAPVRVPLNQPWFSDLERQYIREAFDSGWVTHGHFVERFEEGFKKLTGRAYAVACSSGTAALWLAFQALQIPAGKRVLTMSYTCDAVANAAMSVTGRPPSLVDVEGETWAMDAEYLDGALGDSDIGAVTFNHTYGVMASDTTAIIGACRRRGLPVIEDASEAHGAYLGADRVGPAGSFGDIAVFSCRGEKAVSGGELGVLLTDDEALARRARQWARNGLPSAIVRYWSTVPALNFQPSNLNAALACAQLERLDELVAARRAVHERWRALLGSYEGLRFQMPLGAPAWWLTGILLDERFTAMLPQDLGAALAERGIGTRPGFYGLHMLPHVAQPGAFPVTETLLRRLLILPSGPTVTAEQQEHVVEQLLEIVGRV